MKKHFVVVAAAVAIVVAVLLPRGADEAVPKTAPADFTVPQPPTPPGPARVASEPSPPPQPAPLQATPHPRTAGSPLARELNSASSDARRDVAALHEMLRQYLRQLRQRPGHPIGNDTDLARVLTGKNPMKLVVLPPTHPALSSDGRLRDRWGTPYFIHPRGAGAFEIRSAGPDRQLFTGDDAIANPPQGHTEPVEAAVLSEVAEP